MQSLRLRALRPGQEYTFPVRIRKVLEIKDGHNLFTAPAHYWALKKTETIPTTHTIRVIKSRLRPVRRYSPDIEPISRREVSPVDRAEVSRVVETIVREHSIPENAYLLIDYGVETSFGRFYINLWWFPQDCKIFVKYSDSQYTLGSIGGTAFYTPSYIIPNIIGHENIKQVHGPPLRFEWEEDRIQEMRDRMRVRMPQGMVPYWEQENRREPVAQPESPYRNIPNVGTLNVPAGSTNVVSLDDIKEGDEMVNFQGEHGFNRYYKKLSFDQLPLVNSGIYKKNPTTRQVIRRNNTLRRYRAHIVNRAAGSKASVPTNTGQVAGSKKRRVQRKTRKMRGSYI